MAQIIDMEERRRPRLDGRARTLPPRDPTLLDPTGYVEQLVLPMAYLWRSWMVSWSSLWLAPLGLQVSVVDPAPQPSPQDRVGPSR